MRASGLLAVAMLLGAAYVSAHAEYVRFVYNPGVVKKDVPDPNNPNALPVPPGPQGPGRPVPPPGAEGGEDGFGGLSDLEDELDKTAIRADIIVEVKKVPRLDQQLSQLLNMGGPAAPGAQGAGDANPAAPNPNLAPGGKPKLAFQLEHKWGKSYITETPEITFFRVEDKGAGLQTTKERYEARRKEMGKTLTPEQLLELADYCLTHGLPEQFHKVMDELQKAKADLPQVVQYKKYAQEIKRPITKDNDANAWKDRLGPYKVSQTAHYSFLYDAPGTEPAEVRVRQKQLEENFEAFFYWFALKNKTVPVPDRRLVVVMPNKADDFNQLHNAFDHQALCADGFLSRRENLIVLSASPLYAPFDMMSKATHDMWVHKGWNRDTLLKGELRRSESAENNVLAQQSALLLKVMQEQSELATITHLGSVQLAGAIGLLPPSVVTPQWIRFGVGSLFETPPEAYWPGTGAPHWKYLLKFKIWEEKKLLERPEIALRKVVTDSYFRHVTPAEAQLRDRDRQLQAHTMSWALTYFLAQKPNRLDGLLKYFKELNRLPRDVQIDEEVYLGCFLRAFDLADPNSPDGINARKFQELAREWFQHLRDTNVEVQEAWTRAKEAEEQRIKAVAAAKAKLLGEPPPKPQ